MDHPPAASEAPEFDALVAEAAATLRRGQIDLLSHFWRLGELFARFQIAAAEGRCPGRTARSFAEALRNHGQEATVAQLQLAQRIYDRYKADELAALVERGFTVSHLKTLMPLDEALREKLEQEAVGEDGRVVPTRELRQAVRAARIASLAEAPEADPLPEPVAARTARLEGARAAALTDDDGGPLITDSDDGGDETPPLADSTPASSPHIRVGAVASREYSKPPLAVIKRATGAAEALADVLPALWTALAEVERIGFDSDRAQQNFRQQAELLTTAFAGLQRIAPAALDRLGAVTRS